MNTAFKISKAKTDLICTQPFFATLLLGMPMSEDNAQPTIATDGKRIVYNSAFIDTLTHGELVFVLAHEVMHAVFMHSTRRGQRDARRYNIAADYVINQILVDDKVGTMPKCALLNRKLYEAGKGTTEGVYDLLPDQGAETPQAGQAGGALDNVTDAAQDEAGLAEAEAEAQVNLRGAVNAARAAGKLSKGIERIVGELTAQRADWREVLRNFFTARIKETPSYAKPKRRFLSQDLILPSLQGEGMGCVAIAVDCSGSINAGMLKLFEDNIKAIIEDTAPKKIKVLYFDSEVSSEAEFETAQDFILKPTGGGGTAFSPVFAALSGEEIECAVILTDLECSDFGPAPEFPVLWACTESKGTAPFGEIIQIRKG